MYPDGGVLHSSFARSPGLPSQCSFPRSVSWHSLRGEGVGLTGSDLSGGRASFRRLTGKSIEMTNSQRIGCSCRRSRIDETYLFDRIQLDDVIGDRRVDAGHMKDVNACACM